MLVSGVWHQKGHPGSKTSQQNPLFQRSNRLTDVNMKKRPLKRCVRLFYGAQFAEKSTKALAQRLDRNVCNNREISPVHASSGRCAKFPITKLLRPRKVFASRTISWADTSDSQTSPASYERAAWRRQTWHMADVCKNQNDRVLNVIRWRTDSQPKSRNTAGRHVFRFNCRRRVCVTLITPPPRGALSDDAVWRVCLSRTSGLSREQRGLERLKLAQR